jgi:hypothetical protein
LSEPWRASGAFEYPANTEQERVRVISHLGSGKDEEKSASKVLSIHTPWAKEDGWQRACWFVVDRASPLKAQLFIIAAPEVTIRRYQAIPKSSFAPSPEGFAIHVIRVPAARFVPQPGEAPRLGTFVGPSDYPVYDRVRSPLPGQQQTLSDTEFAADPCRLDLARVERDVRRIRVGHIHGQWSVEAEIVNDDSPGAVDVIVQPHPQANSLGVPSAFLVQIFTLGDVAISAKQRLPAAAFVPYSLLGVKLLLSWLSGEGDQVSSLLEVQVAAIPIDKWNLDGYAPEGANFTSLSPVPSNPLLENLSLDFVVAGLEMTPVVGTFFEFGHLAYCAVTGQDIFGRDVSQSDLVLMGVFAVIGIIPGVPGSSGLRALKEHGDKLLARINPMAPSMISLNPGPIELFHRLLSGNSSHIVKDIAGQVGTKELDEAIESFSKRIDGTLDDLALVRKIADVLVPHLKDIPRVELIPEKLFAQAMGAVHPGSLPEIEIWRKNLPDSQASALGEEFYQYFEEALHTQQPALLRSYMLANLPSDAWPAYSNAVRSEVLGRVFDEATGGFRSLKAEESLFREMLEAGYQDYATKKLRKQIHPRAALDWALQQGRNSRFHMLMQMEFGPDFKAILDPKWLDSRKWDYTVTPQTKAVFEKFWRGSAHPDGASILMNYSDMVSLRSTLAGDEAATIYQRLPADHILDDRWARAGVMTEGFIDPSEFTAMLVPHNFEVAQNLIKAGVDPGNIWYLHSVKGRYSLQIFPPGREVQFTAQEIYNGYTHLYVNLMNLPAEFFEENFGHIFQELAYGMGQKIVRGNPSFEVMSKRVRIALERVNQLPMPPREKVRRR